MLSKYALIIVGDPDSDLTKQTIKSAIKHTPPSWQCEVIVEPFEKEKGYNAALNAGAKKATSDILIFCNNDLIFQKGWFSSLIGGLNYYDSVSPWCPQTHSQWWGSKRPVLPEAGYQVGKHIAGWCIAMWRETFDKVGGFDERLKFWCCDNAYSEQLQSAGLTHALIPNSYVVHLQSQTLNKLRGGNEYSQLTRQQIKLFNKLYNKNLFGIGV